jgi:hypothetical protein
LYYQKFNDHEIWYLDENRKDLLHEIKFCYQEGLLPEDYSLTQLEAFEKKRNTLSDEQLAEYDNLLTQSFEKIALHLFKVKLNQGPQGTLDINPATGLEFTTSVQRTMYVAGPNGKIREIADGTTFTDCNYWKRFAVPAVSSDDAFIEVLTDDGSIYSDIPSENNYPVVTSVTVHADEVFADNVIDIAGATGSYIVDYTGFTSSAPYNTYDNGFTFSTSISLSYGTSGVIYKDKLKDLLIDSISDNRDGIMDIMDSEMIISDISSNVINSISTVGTYSLTFNFEDLANNNLQGVNLNLIII